MSRLHSSAVLILTVLVLNCSLAAGAQQPKKIARIGYLSPFDPSRDSPSFDGVRQALGKLGYKEGQNITIEYRNAEGKPDRFPELAAELVRLKVDLIVTTGDAPTLAVKHATNTIPIVMLGRGIDPVEAGLIQNLARPGGNVTGITSIPVQLGGKRLELLKEAVPKLVRIAVLYDPTNQASVLQLKEGQTVAPTLKLIVRPWAARDADGIDKSFASTSKESPDGLFVAGSPLMGGNRKRIVGLALKHRLPSVYPNDQYVDAGGLMYYGADVADSYRLIAGYVDKILKGANPTELPVAQPQKFELVINLKTAKQIGLAIPQKVLARADRVIR